MKTHRTMLAVAVLGFALTLLSSGAYGAVIYVKWDSPNDGPGTDWDHAFHQVQSAVDIVSPGDEVRVARGEYAEVVSVRCSFASLSGGYAGEGDVRDIKRWETIFVSAGMLLGREAGTVHVDGFTFRGGRVSISCSSCSPTISNNTIVGGKTGGGIWCSSSSPTIAGNTVCTCAGSSGGGIYCRKGSPTITGNTIKDNTATLSYSGGGGIYLSGCSAATIANNIISGNSATHGGGVYCDSSSATISGNDVVANRAPSTSSYSGIGGGIYGQSSSLLIYGNRIRDNTASAGGGVYCNEATVTNNTVTNNRGYAMFGGGLSVESGTVVGNTILGNISGTGTGSYGGGLNCGSVLVANNIVAFNSSGIHRGGGTATLRNNCVYNNVYNNKSRDYTGTQPGEGDISVDPRFVNREGGDYHLLASSPCVDAGTNDGAPTTDFDGFIRPQDGNGDGTAICDIGAYEFPLNPSLAKKNYADGVSIAFGSAAVTAKFGSLGQVYVENLDRSSGVRVDTSETLAESALVNVQGTMQTDMTTGERFVQALTGWPKPTGGTNALKSLTLPGKNIGGADNGLQSGVWEKRWVTGTGGPEYLWTEAIGLNNIGLLVTVIGKITYAESGEFWMDDGSKLDDDSGHIGAKVIGTPPDDPVGKWVKVTGISACEKKGDDLVRLIRALDVAEME